MTDEPFAYDLATIRQLLLAAFTPESLRRFCQDRPTFRPVVASFGPGQGLDDMVDRLIDYCQTQLLWDELLAAVEETSPRHYARFAGRLPAPGELDTPLPTVVDAYLEAMRARCSRLETRPYRQLSELRGAPARLSLLDEGERAGVYVPLRFDLHPSRAMLAREFEGEALAEGQVLRQEMGRDLARGDVDLAEVLAAPGHLVFIGAAGCGKSTLLRLIAALLAARDPDQAHAHLALEPRPHSQYPIPIFVALRDFEHACQTRPETYRRDVEGLLRFLDDHFQRWQPDPHIPPGLLGDAVRGGRAWLLLDALDEVADFDHRLAVRQVIERLADAFPATRLLVTARVAAYSGGNSRLDERFHVAAVRDLTREQWAPLVERLYAGLEANAGLAAERARLLLARIDGAPALQEMVKTPLMVWTATLIHYAERELPEQRAELYNAYVDVLLGERLHEEESAEPAQGLREGRWPLDERRLYLTYAAYQVHREAEAERGGGKREALVVVDERDLVHRILAPFMAEWMMLDGSERQVQRQARREATDFVAFMAERSGLLQAHEEGFSFGDHLTIQEFLAAYYLAENVRGTGEWPAFLRAHVGQTWWREVFLLMAGYLLQSPRQARRFLLNELGGLAGEAEARGDHGGDDGADSQAYGLAWAGRALLEIPEGRVSWHAGARDELARRLVKVLWQNPPAASVAARVEAGEVLGRLGDPRFSGPHRLPEFITIPGGRFWMGSEEAEVEQLLQRAKQDYERDWFRAELPRHQVELDDFALARYPTTNAMFTCFVEDGGYGDERWWAEAQAAEVWQPDGTVKDWFGDVRNQPRYWDEAPLNGPNQPVVGVTWYEALAYCRWLTAVLADGQEYRLPTEAEWERVARAADGRRYPWGDAWQEGRANSGELGLERTTPVGIFPDGASGEGVLDLAGNVWEWCSDWYGADTYLQRAGQVEENPVGPDSGQYKVLRGGSCYDDRNIVRCASRYFYYLPVGWRNPVGFRVARGPSRQAP